MKYFDTNNKLKKLVLATKYFVTKYDKIKKKKKGFGDEIFCHQI